MCKCNRMQIAIDACVLFVQSLPLGCKFSVLSFGTSWSQVFDEEFVDYNEDTKRRAITSIKLFEDNMGGTEIL